MSQNNILKSCSLSDRVRMQIRNRQNSINKNVKKIILISNPSQNNKEMFIFKREYLYKNHTKIITFTTKLDLRVEKIFSFWIEKSKIENEKWEICEKWNLLTFFDLYESKTPKLQNTYKPDKNLVKQFDKETTHQNKYLEETTHQNKYLEETIKKLEEQTNNWQQKIITESEEKHKLLLEQKDINFKNMQQALEIKREYEIAKMTVENELNIERIISANRELENQKLLTMIKKLQKNSSADINIVEASHYRAKTILRENKFWTINTTEEEGKKIYVYEFEISPQGSKYGLKIVTCTTNQIFKIGDLIRWKMHMSKVWDEKWEINDKDNGVFIKKRTKE